MTWSDYMERQRNFFEFIRDFITSFIYSIKDNIHALREPQEADEKTYRAAHVLRIVVDVAILAAMLGVAVFVLYYAIQFVMMVVDFLAQPQHRALMILARGLLIIGALALIIDSFRRKPKQRTEREEDAIKRGLQKDILAASQKLSVMYGLERPDATSDLSSFELSPCEEIQGVAVFKFSLEKDVSSDKPFDAQRFKKSLVRRLKKMERDYEMTTATPYGFIHNDEELCSILIFDITDNGDYVEIRCARADEESYALYTRE
jgi:hypothetical protein